MPLEGSAGSALGLLLERGLDPPSKPECDMLTKMRFYNRQVGIFCEKSIPGSCHGQMGVCLVEKSQRCSVTLDTYYTFVKAHRMHKGQP